MEENKIRKYIDILNEEKEQDLIFTRSISKVVDVAKVWSSLPKETDSIIFNKSSSQFFFIKNLDGIYLGAILDMIDDLHWYVAPDHRKKGHLTKALLGSVLPYLFNDGRETQRITIDQEIGEQNYSNSKKVATSIGFNSVNELHNQFEIDLSQFKTLDNELFDNNYQIDSERISLLRKRVFYASNVLLKVSDELKMAYKNDKGISLIGKQLRSLIYEIDDLVWEHEN